jgi:superfamily II DNA or RNA helicase
LLTRFDFYDYQDRLVEHITTRARRGESSAGWVDVGLGKTVAGLTAVRDLGVPALVSAPLRVARDVWDAEVEQWCHLNHLTVAKIVGTPKQREAALARKADVHTINRENLDWLRDHFLEQVGEYRWKQKAPWRWPLLILDESQNYKSQSSTRHDVIWKFRNFFKPVIVELTGTPATRSYEDIWGQLRLLDGGQRLGHTEKAFLDRWFIAPKMYEYGYTLKDHSAKEIQALLKDIVISMRAEDYLDLPPVIYNPVRVNLPRAALELYRKFERSSLMTLKGKTITAVNAGVLHGKLLQAANGALYTGEGREYEIFHDEKIERLLELLESLPPPVLIGYAYRHDLERIQKALTRLKGTAMVLKTQKSMTAFREGTVDYGIIHPGSGGHGLNDLYLSGSENLVWFGLTNDLEMWLQLNGRLTGGHRRAGRNVVIHSVIANETADDEALALLTRKDAVQDDLTRAMVRRVR